MLSWSTITIVMSNLWVFLKPVLLMILNNVTAELIEFVTETVTGLKDTDLSSEEKRIAAFEAVKVKLADDGDSLTDSVIYLLIEIAVNKMKEDD